MDYYAQALVFDNGSGVFKAGLAGEGDRPSTVLPTVRGKSGATSYFGYKALEKVPAPKIERPISKGVVKNWEAMEDLWDRTFHHDLRLQTEKHPFVLTDGANPSKDDREKLLHIMFENFGCPALLISPPAVLSLQAVGKDTGVVVESGEDSTLIVPIYEGCVVKHGIKEFPVSGSTFTRAVKQSLLSSGLEFSAQDVESIKQNHLEVGAEGSPAKSDKEIVLPSTEAKVRLEASALNCAGAFFEPSLLGLDGPGLGELIISSIRSLDPELRKPMLQNVVLGGGNTMVHGLCERLQADLEKRAVGADCKVHAPATRAFSAWLGGASLASRPDFQQMLVSRAEYDEHGPQIAWLRFI